MAHYFQISDSKVDELEWYPRGEKKGKEPSRKVLACLDVLTLIRVELPIKVHKKVMPKLYKRLPSHWGYL